MQIMCCFTCVAQKVMSTEVKRGEPSPSTAPVHKSIRGTIQVEPGAGPPPGLTGYRNITGALQAFAISGITGAFKLFGEA